MTTFSRAVRSPLLPAVLLLTAAWSSTTSYGRQEMANDGFIFFTSDRAFPSLAGMCHNCEDIYVMAPDGAGASPDGTNVMRLTFGGGLANDTTAYNSTAADWSHSKQLVAFQSNRINRIPHIFLMNADGGDPQLLVSLPGGASFPSFSQSGNDVCLHSQTMPRDYTINADGTNLSQITVTTPPGFSGFPSWGKWSARTSR